MVFVVSTLGHRLPQLRRLLRCVEQEVPDATILVADQSAGDAVASLIADFPCARLVPSDRGLSRGRNACLAAVDWREPAVILFPNDNSWYAPGTLADRRRRMVDLGLDVLAGRLVYGDGSAPFPVPRGRTVIGPTNAALAMSSTLAFHSSCFASGLRFNEDLGSGAGTPYQAGEETDLLLTVIERGARAELHADVVIHGEDATRAMPLRQQVRKTWGYSRSHTHVLLLHRLPMKVIAVSLVRPLVRSLLSVATFDFRQGVIALTRFLGRCRGLVPW